MTTNSSNYEDAETLEEFGRQNDPVNPFMVSLISFLALFILPFSAYFWPIAIAVPIAALVGIILGHRTRGRLKKDHSAVPGLTLAGLILGYTAFVLSGLWIALIAMRILVAIAIGG